MMMLKCWNCFTHWPPIFDDGVRHWQDDDNQCHLSSGKLWVTSRRDLQSWYAVSGNMSDFQFPPTIFIYLWKKTMFDPTQNVTTAVSWFMVSATWRGIFRIWFKDKAIVVSPHSTEGLFWSFIADLMQYFLGVEEQIQLWCYPPPELRLSHLCL